MLKLTRRVTTLFLQELPEQIEHFDAYMYVMVGRKPEKVIPEAEFGTHVRINPCILDWSKKTITMTIPPDINEGIESFNDLDPNFYEAIEAAFLALIKSCL